MSEAASGSFGQYLLAAGRIEPRQLVDAERYRQELGGRLDSVLVNMGLLQQDELQELFADYLGLPKFDPSTEVVDVPPSWLATADLKPWLQAQALPFRLHDGVVDLAVTDPYRLELFELCQANRWRPQLFLCTQPQLDLLRLELDAARANGHDVGNDGGADLDRLRELAFGAPTINLVNNLIVRGVKLGASDLHIEPFAGRYRARYRIDGMLHEAPHIPSELQLAVLSRIKILASMDIAEKRRPQDGKIETRVGGTELDIRCSALPLGEGESVVMRFLVKGALRFDLAALGYAPDLVARINADLKRTTGVILMTGPTGSGKTTSLYSFLSTLNQPHVKIITLEDPIEYQLAGVNQVQVRPDIGFDFANGLRSIVRQDPDIIMVGEIRDNETARVAMQSALTGHLVFSTVHTNDAPTAFTRLLDLGVEEYLLNASVISIMAQRLTRKLCSHCSEPHPDAGQLCERPDIREVLTMNPQVTLDVRQAKGCEHCGHTGYRGRVAILEYLPNDAELQRMPKDQGFLQAVADYRQRHRLRTLRQDGLIKVLQGITSIEEVMRVAG